VKARYCEKKLLTLHNDSEPSGRPTHETPTVSGVEPGALSFTRDIIGEGKDRVGQAQEFDGRPQHAPETLKRRDWKRGADSEKRKGPVRLAA
jgi:hypothetical protein